MPVDGCDCSACTSPDDEDRPLCPVDECHFLLERRDEEWWCPSHGIQNPGGPEYETENDPVETEQSELITDGGRDSCGQATQQDQEDRPDEVDDFVDAYAEYCQEADDSGTACETLNAYLFDAVAASHLDSYPEPDNRDVPSEFLELPIGFNDVLTPDTIGRYFDEAVAVLHNRAGTGSFYTPETIVEYIDQETIRPRARDILADDIGVDDLPDDNHDIPVEDLAAACSSEQAREAIGAVSSMSICDPACGSGQFLVGAIDEVAAILSALGSQIERDVADPVWVWEASKTVYGVDLVEETVRMARLRVKLRVLESLPTDAPLQTASQIRASHHLTHQIRQGNSLIGISDMNKLEDALREDDPSGQTTLTRGEFA